MLLVLLSVPRLGDYRFSCHVGSLVAAHSDVAGVRGDEVPGFGVPRVSESGPVRKKISTKQKNSCAPRGVIDSFSSTRLAETASGWCFQVFPCLITLGGVVIMLMGVLFMNMTELV